eukprot:m51a1_g10951 hypothetical protein (182) ;mRNA; f:199735-200343
MDARPSSRPQAQAGTKNKKKLAVLDQGRMRVNYLYQAATLMAGVNRDLAAFYSQQMRRVALKNTFRLAPDIKRNLCKQCGFPLHGRNGSSTRLRTKAGLKVAVVRCSRCSCTRSLPTNYATPRKPREAATSGPQEPAAATAAAGAPQEPLQAAAIAPEAAPAAQEQPQATRVDHSTEEPTQ